MATVSRVQGTSDSRKGWANPIPAGLTDHPWRATPVPHPNEIRAEKARREIEREAERKAATPNARQSLRDAHARRAEAQAELERIVGLRGRANDLVRALEQRHQQLTDEVRAGNCAAADQLVRALGDNQSWQTTGLSPPNEQLQNQLASVSGRLGIARDAVQQLSEEHRAALDAVREADTGVEVAAAAVAIDFAVHEGEEIEHLQAELQARRTDLNSLTSAITTSLRRLGSHQLYLPPICSRVLAGLDARVDIRWSEKLKALSTDAEAEL